MVDVRLMLVCAALASGTGVFNESLAQQDLWLVQAAGCDPDSLGKWSCEPCQRVGLSNVSVVQDRDFKVMAVTGLKDDGRGVLIFRGWYNGALASHARRTG